MCYHIFAAKIVCITIQQQLVTRCTQYIFYSSVLLQSLFCHPRIPPSVEYHYIGGANVEVGTIHIALQGPTQHIGQPLVLPVRTPYSTLLLRGCSKAEQIYCNTVWTLIFAFLFSRMRVPQYYIKYIDYISVLICSSHISHKVKHVWAAQSRSSYSKAMTPFRATLLCVLVPRRIILRIRPIPTYSA